MRSRTMPITVTLLIFALYGAICMMTSVHRVLAQSTISPGPGLPTQGSIFVPYADVVVGPIVTQIQPVNLNRIVLTCTNNDSVNAIRVGDSTVAATRGQRVPANGSISITSTAAIFGFSEGGSVTISCSEEILR